MGKIFHDADFLTFSLKLAETLTDAESKQKDSSSKVSCRLKSYQVDANKLRKFIQRLSYLSSSLFYLKILASAKHLHQEKMKSEFSKY